MTKARDALINSRIGILQAGLGVATSRSQRRLLAIVAHQLTPAECAELRDMALGRQAMATANALKIVMLSDDEGLLDAPRDVSAL